MKCKHILLTCVLLLMLLREIHLLQPTFGISNGSASARSGSARARSAGASASSAGGVSGTKASSGSASSAISSISGPRYLKWIDYKEKPCKSRQIPGQSVVCVCNTTYCDELARVAPAQGKYVTYTTSEAGSRFVRVTRDLRTEDYGEINSEILVLDLSHKYQKVEGFGGAVTDSASINWLNLTEPSLRQALINSYFGVSGLEYNMLRVPIGGCDFSTHPYAYNEQPSDDLTLSNFSLAYEDYQYKIPMIKSILQTAVNPVHILATTWSPPLWMKTDETWGQENELKPEYYQTYADYHIRFIEEYKANGIPIWGISTTNEPSNGMIGYVQFNSLGWSPFKQGKWIAENLGPTVRSSQYSDLKILANDDNRVTIPWWFTLMVNIIPDALQYIDGIAVHFYLDKVIPPEVLSLVTDIYPDKFLISTEACEGGFDTQKVILGSWDRAKSYITDILQDLNYNVVGWIDWNLCLNAQGGPNWVENFVDSPIIVFPENKEFVKQPMFYALGHFSKFLPRGSQRIKVNQRTPPRSSPVDNVAFLTTRNTVVVILYNDGGPRSVTIQLGQKKAVVPMEARSVVTVEMALKQN